LAVQYVRAHAMGLKQVLVPVLAIEHDQAALKAGADLALRFGGRATALIVAIWQGSGFADAQSPLSDALMDLVKGAQSSAAVERTKIIAWLERSTYAFDVQDVTAEAALGRDEIVSHARVADLIIMARAGQHAHARRELLEDVVFKSGRPTLLVASPTRQRQKWERILIAWNARPEVVRAIAGAMPLLQAAKDVRIVTVDAAPNTAWRGEAPGRDLAAYLAFHGVRAEVSNLDGLGREHARAIADAALDFDADLVVMGAYGHSRAREFVLGGVTRDLLAGSKTALLLAH
jgi:nucleotide-binding universal stress UspA family protein